METITIQIQIPIDNESVTVSVIYPNKAGSNTLPKESFEACIKVLCSVFSLSDEAMLQYCNTLKHQQHNHKKHTEQIEV